MERVECVVFDVDDTLYLERDYVRSGFEAVGEWVESELGLSDFAQRAWEQFERGNRDTIFNDVLDAEGVSYDRPLIEELVAVYRGHEPDIELESDARTCLTRLADSHELAGLTGGPVESQRAKVRALGVGEVLDPIVYARSWGAEYDKPHPRPFRAVEDETGRSGAELVYVADNPAKDFEVPSERGWKSIRVRREGSLHEDVPSDCEREVSNLREVLELFEVSDVDGTDS